MRHTWTISDETGAVQIGITADTEARGIAIEHSYNWHSHTQTATIVDLLTQANAWLLENGGVI